MADFAVQMPQVGESVTEAIIANWLVKPGDKVRKYDPMVEVVTDKVNMEVPAPVEGVISKVITGEGATVAMGAVIAHMEIADAESSPSNGSPDAAPVSPESAGPEKERAGRIGTMVMGANVGPTGGEFRDTSLQSTAEPPEYTKNKSTETAIPSDGAKHSGVTYSPVVTRLASRHGVDLSKLSGTGRGGRVTKRDVERYLEGTESVPVNRTKEYAGTPSSSNDETLASSPVRSMIADHMSRSVREIPHAWAALEVDMSRVVDFRQSHRDLIETRTGCNLTYLPISMYLLARSLRRHRRLNASWDQGEIVLKTDINVGLAVATDVGLLVPVLKDADGLDFESTVSGCERLINAARGGRLIIDEVQGGTFTLNNTGSFGSFLGGAIINHPQAAILNTESITRRPVVVSDSDANEAIGIRPIMNLCLSFDHRILDGAEAMAFLNDLKSQFEAPDIEVG